MKQLSIIYLLLIFFLFESCSHDNNDRYSIVLERFEDVPLENIHINETDILDLFSDNYEIIAAPEGAVHFTGLGNHLLVFEDSLLIATNDLMLRAIDLETGDLLNEYSFKGKGPGEFQDISGIISTDNKIIIVDGRLMKISIFDYQWNHIQDHVLEGIDARSHPGFIFNSPYFYYPIRDHNDHLIQRIKLNHSEESVRSFHNRIISYAKKPEQYNRLVISSAENLEIVVLHLALPYLFFYNEDLKLQQIIHVHLPGIDRIGVDESEYSGSSAGAESVQTGAFLNPPPIEIETSKAISMMFFLRNVVYAEDKLFFYYANRYADQQFLTMLEKKQGQWIKGGSYRFIKPDGDQFTVFNIVYNEPYLYLSSRWEEDIIRINTDNLLR